MSTLYPGYKKESNVFFDIVMECLKGEVEEGAFWDAVAEDAVFEFCYDVPGFTNRIEGRDAYRDWFMEYNIYLHKAEGLRVYKAPEQNAVIIEYEVYGTIEHSKKEYHNRFCSIVTIENRKITYWRDYMDTLAVIKFNS